jgi:hypothetical protein
MMRTFCGFCFDPKDIKNDVKLDNSDLGNIGVLKIDKEDNNSIGTSKGTMNSQSHILNLVSTKEPECELDKSGGNVNCNSNGIGLGIGLGLNKAESKKLFDIHPILKNNSENTKENDKSKINIKF